MLQGLLGIPVSGVLLSGLMIAATVTADRRRGIAGA